MTKAQDDAEAVAVLRRLVAACGCVEPLRSRVSMDTVKQVKEAIKFVNAYENAVAFLKTKKRRAR